MKKTKVISFANNKGGSGKSTTCSNIGYGLALLNNKVLLIDGDMQLNLSLSFLSEEKVLEYAAGEKNLYHALKQQKDLSEYIIPTGYDNLDLIPSSTLMSSIEYELFTKWQRSYILQHCLEKVVAEGGYDYILIDSPPTLGGWVTNILCASDYLIIPVEASPWGLFGLANILEFLNEAKQIAPQLSLMGIAVTKVDERKNYFKQTIDTLKAIENVHVFETFIRVDSMIEWAQDNSKPVIAYKKSCRSAKEYMKLTEEVHHIAGRKRKYSKSHESK